MQTVRKLIKVQIMLIIVAANLRRRSIRKGTTIQVKQYIGNVLENVILKLEISGMNMSQKVISENQDYKILWDFSMQTDHVLEAWRPDLVVVDKKRTCKIIDFAVPGSSSIEEKKQKTKKYQDLKEELQKIWNVKVKIIPLVVGSLGAIPKQLGNSLKEIGVEAEIGQVQKTVL